MPFAVAAAAALFARPSAATLVVAAVASGGTLGVYVGLLPWQVLLVVAMAFVMTGPWPAWATRFPRRRGRLARAAVLLASLAALTAALAPIAVYRGYEFSTLASGFSGGGPFQSYPSDVYLGLLLGVIPDAGTAVGGLEALAALVVVAALLLSLTTSHLRPARAPVALAAAVLLATAFVFNNYHRSGFNYGTYKTVISGGALLAGVIVVGLLARADTRRATALSVTAVVACGLVWALGATSLMRDEHRSRPGFRQQDRALGAALRALPPGSSVLVEGADAGGTPDMFQLRMMTAYFVTTSPSFSASGLWTTPSYISPARCPHSVPRRRGTTCSPRGPHRSAPAAPRNGGRGPSTSAARRWSTSPSTGRPGTGPSETTGASSSGSPGLPSSCWATPRRSPAACASGCSSRATGSTAPRRYGPRRPPSRGACRPGRRCPWRSRSPCRRTESGSSPSTRPPGRVRASPDPRMLMLRVRRVRAAPVRDEAMLPAS